MAELEETENKSMNSFCTSKSVSSTSKKPAVSKNTALKSKFGTHNRSDTLQMPLSVRFKDHIDENKDN